MQYWGVHLPPRGILRMTAVTESNEHTYTNRIWPAVFFRHYNAHNALLKTVLPTRTIYMYPLLQNIVLYLLNKFSQELFNIAYLSHSFLSTIVVHMFVFLLFYAHLVVIRKCACHPYITSQNFSPGTIFNRTTSFLFSYRHLQFVL